MSLPLYRAATGDRSADHVGEVEALNRSGLEAIRAHQLARLRRVVAAAAESDFYAPRLRAAGIADPAAMDFEDFARLPLLTRDDLRDHADRIRRRDVPASELRWSATGGSTASPVRFQLDEASWRRRWSATIAFDRWLGYEPGLRAAYLWGAPRDYAGHDTPRARLKSALVTRKRFYPGSPLDAATLDRYADDLARWRPVLLQAYPTPLEILSRHLVERGRTLAIPAISCTAEPLLPRQVEAIRRAFGVVPFDWYGSREGGRVATECARHDGLHVNAYGLLVEIVTDPALGPGGPGRIVFTDLWNEGFPLLRYDTADLGRWVEGACACGSALPRLGGLVGRTTDCFVNSRGVRVPGVALTNRILKSDDEVKEMQVVQHAVGRFEMKVVPGPAWTADSEGALVRALADFMDEPVEATVVRVAAIPREPSGKLRFCRSLVDPLAG